MYSNQNSRNQQFATSLENCKNFDKDVRYTGANDLCNEIVKSAEPLEESLEKRICTAFVSHLEDSSVEVKSNAVRCIQRVSSKIRESNLMMITQKLADAIVAGNEETLDIYSLTVRGIISECKEESANSLIKTLYPCVYKGIEAGSAPVKEECLEICTELFKQFGLIILRQQDLINREQLMKSINNQLA